MKGVRAGLIITLLCLLCSSCSESRGSTLGSQEIKNCAWLIEDLCHNLPRSAAELVSADSSIAQLNIAAWLAKGDISTRQNVFPIHIQRRRDQWLLISQGLHSSSIISRDDGLLELSKNIDPVQLHIFKQSVADENQLRLTIDQLTLQHAGLQTRSRRGRVFLDALKQARIELDRSIGKKDG